MHKHFRILAISEHLRNHGFDPETYPHTRLPGIWVKLREYFDLEAVDERENSLDPPEEQGRPRRYLDFDLPKAEYGELILAKALADPSEAPSSPAQWDPYAPRDNRKRKRVASESAPKTRSSTVEDTEGEASAPSPARKPARGGRKRATSKTSRAKEEAKPESSSSEAEASQQEDSESGDADEEGEEEDTGTPASKTGRGGRGRGGARGRGRGRARGRGRG